MLSITCLLKHLLLWVSQPQCSLKGILATDNMGLIDRVTAQMALKYPILNTVFQPDWDIIQNI